MLCLAYIQNGSSSKTAFLYLEKKNVSNYSGAGLPLSPELGILVKLCASNVTLKEYKMRIHY